MVYGNMLRNRTYPMSVSSERTFQAMAAVEYAMKEKIGIILCPFGLATSNMKILWKKSEIGWLHCKNYITHLMQSLIELMLKR